MNEWLVKQQVREIIHWFLSLPEEEQDRILKNMNRKVFKYYYYK